MVEGGCDKKYLEQLGDYFGFKKPNIISADGVTNVEKYLDFYNSYYKDNTTAYKPCVNGIIWQWFGRAWCLLQNKKR